MFHNGMTSSSRLKVCSPVLGCCPMRRSEKETPAVDVTVLTDFVQPHECGEKSARETDCESTADRGSWIGAGPVGLTPLTT